MDNGWISVKDKLPEPEAMVLICDKSGNIFIGYCYAEIWYRDDGGALIGIIAWQPLPQPPHNNK